MATWRAPAAMKQLRTILRARPGLADVKVLIGHPGDPPPKEAIVMFGVDGDQEYRTVGGTRREDEFTIGNSIFITKPGHGEDIAEAALDRATAVLAEVEEALRADKNLSDTVRIAELRNPRLDQGTLERGRWCEITFDVFCKADI